MRSRLLLAASAIAGTTGSVVLIMVWSGAIDWEHAESVAFLLVAGGLFLAALAVFDGIKALRTDMALIRERTKDAAANTRRLSGRIDEIRQEVFLGPIAHVPGQLGQMEGWLHEQADQEPQRREHAGPTTPDSVFDAVFLLNLDADKTKLDHSEAMLTRHGIDFIRFAAIDGNDERFDQEWMEYVDRPPILPAERHLGTRLIESRGAWGYLKSMEALLAEAQRRGLRRILVLEDDVLLHREFVARFAEAWSELPDNWRLVYLGSAQVDRTKITRFSDHLYHPGAMANGSYAVAIDSSVFGQALAAAGRFDWPFDAGALREIDASYPTQVFAVDPPLVIADVSRSTIRPERDMDAHVAKHGWNPCDYEDPRRV